MKHSNQHNSLQITVSFMRLLPELTHQPVSHKNRKGLGAIPSCNPDHHTSPQSHRMSCSTHSYSLAAADFLFHLLLLATQRTKNRKSRFRNKVRGKYVLVKVKLEMRLHFPAIKSVMKTFCFVLFMAASCEAAKERTENFKQTNKKKTKSAFQ